MLKWTFIIITACYLSACAQNGQFPSEIPNDPEVQKAYHNLSNDLKNFKPLPEDASPCAEDLGLMDKVQGTWKSKKSFEIDGHSQCQSLFILGADSRYTLATNCADGALQIEQGSLKVCQNFSVLKQAFSGSCSQDADFSKPRRIAFGIRQISNSQDNVQNTLVLDKNSKVWFAEITSTFEKISDTDKAQDAFSQGDLLHSCISHTSKD